MSDFSYIRFGECDAKKCETLIEYQLEKHEKEKALSASEVMLTIPSLLPSIPIDSRVSSSLCSSLTSSVRATLIYAHRFKFHFKIKSEVKSEVEF